jgi:hypothetical protein
VRKQRERLEEVSGAAGVCRNIDASSGIKEQSVANGDSSFSRVD